MPEKLTDARVRSAPCKGGRRTSYLDAVEAGLELRVHPDGRRVFALRRSFDGRDVRMTLGRYGPSPLLSLEAARAMAAEMKVRLRKEGDFRAADRLKRKSDDARRAFTVSDLSDVWLQEQAKHLRASTLLLYRQRLDTHVRPAFGARPLEAIARADVRELVTAIGARGHIRTANAVKQILASLYRFAQDELEREVNNPAAGMKGYKQEPRARVLSDREIKLFVEALDDPEISPGPQVALVLKFALFSGQRIGEVVAMRDSEIDFAERVWRNPGGIRTKSGRPNTVPLSSSLLRFIRDAHAIRTATPKNDAPVFLSPHKQNEPITRHAVSRGMARLLERLEGLEQATPHDLRRTVRTILSRERLGVSYEDAERLLSHITGSSLSRVYNHHDYAREKRRALERLERELHRIIEGRRIEDENNIVELGRRV